MESKIVMVVKIFLFSLALGWSIHMIGDSFAAQVNETRIVQEKDTLLILEEEKTSLGEVRWVTATYYNPVPEQCNSNPLITASGRKIDLEKLRKEEIKWIAVSRDLLKTYKYGDVVRITCEHDPSIDGDYVIADTMNERFENMIDLLWHPDKKGKGKWKNVQIQKVLN